jgi:4-hydroxythreonine-4-phosphate dehydrogenase
MGDPAGIGPEIAAKIFGNKVVYSICKPVLVGHIPTINNTLAYLGSRLRSHAINYVSEARFIPGTIDIFPVGDTFTRVVKPGKVSAEAGEIAFLAIKTAIDLANDKIVDGTVTGPINKESINMAGHHFSGHTEIYAHMTKTSKYAMLLVDENLKIIHATTHVSLRNACDLIKKERIIDVIHLLNSGLLKLGISNPKIGVAGLNPHSGDGGLFGSEDYEEILPAVLEARKNGINVDGPIPADTLFALATGGKYDGCVAMYHDQGHIPFKVLGFNWDKKKNKMNSVRGVNITLGLPIVRTSVDHGTAFEIAGKGIASPDALFQAIQYATKLVN